MNAVEKGARWLRRGLGFEDDAMLVVALRPKYKRFLDLFYRFCRKGYLVRMFGGVLWATTFAGTRGNR